MPGIGRMVKESMVQEISAQLGERPNFFVASSRGLAVADEDQLRRKLHGAKASFKLVKRRLGRRVLEQLAVPGAADLAPERDAALGLILAGEDSLLAAKELVEFIKEHEDRIGVRGGVVDGRLLTPAEVNQLAALPSRDVLLAQVVGTIEAPISDLVFTIERLIQDVLWVVQEAGKQPRPAGGRDEGAQAAAKPGVEQPTSPQAPQAQAGETSEGEKEDRKE